MGREFRASAFPRAAAPEEAAVALAVRALRLGAGKAGLFVDPITWRAGGFLIT